MTTETTPYLLTRSYKRFRLDRIAPDDVDIMDIAHALSRVCRFGGHTPYHYSVAQHSIMVSKMLPIELAFVGLMHDAAEAYVGDTIYPVKQMCPHDNELKELEDRVWTAIVEKFNLSAYQGIYFSGARWEMDEAVKDADLRALMVEASFVMGVKDPTHQDGWPDLPVDYRHEASVRHRDAEDVRREFIGLFNDLRDNGVW